MLKLVSKFAMDIFPSVIATILGAYIVNHYINAKPPADAAATAAAVSTVDPKKAVSNPDSKPAERSADLGNTPGPGVRAKGVSEKSIGDTNEKGKLLASTFVRRITLQENQLQENQFQENKLPENQLQESHG